MKKIGLCFLVLIVSLISCVSCSPGEKISSTAPPPPTYRIERPTPEIIRVIGIQTNDMASNYGWGYGDALTKAIKEIGKNYIIEDITPITYRSGEGSITKDLYLKVKPR